jgi:hypothetical protein
VEKTNYKSLTISLIAGVNTSLIALGVYHLNASQLQGLDAIVSIVFTIGGIVFSHKKPFIAAVKQLFKKTK